MEQKIINFTKPGKNRIKKLHDWALHTFPADGYREVHSRNIRKYFGNYSEDDAKLSQFLHQELLIEDGKNYSNFPGKEYAKNYKFNWQNLGEIMVNAGLLNTPEIEFSKAFFEAHSFRHLYPNYKVRVMKRQECSSGCPRYISVHDSLSRDARKILWRGQYDYDIEASVYCLIAQHALNIGYPEAGLYEILKVSQDKTEYRKRIADIFSPFVEDFESAIKIAKALLLTIVYNGFIPYPTFTSFKHVLIEHNIHETEWDKLFRRLKADDFLQILCNELKLLWPALQTYWEQTHNKLGRDTFKKWYTQHKPNQFAYDDNGEVIFLDEIEKYSAQKFRSYIYQEIERNILDLIIGWFSRRGHKINTLHDGFWTPLNLDLRELSDFIAAQSGFDVRFSKDVL